MLSLNQLLNEAPNDATSEDKGKGKRPVPTEDGASDQAGPRKKAAVGHTSAAVDRGEEEEEPHSQLAASDMDAPVLFSTIQYWLKYNPLTESTSNEAVDAKSRDNLHALKRLFALKKRLSVFLRLNTSHEDGGRREIATNLGNELKEKIGDLICALQVTGVTTKLSENDIYDMGTDEKHESAFRKLVYPDLQLKDGLEAHSSLKVVEMTLVQCLEAMLSFMDRKEQQIIFSNSSSVRKSIKRHGVTRTWARVVCLLHKLQNVKEDDVVSAKEGSFDRFRKGKSGSKKLAALHTSLIDVYKQAEGKEKQAIRPWETERDPEFRRILKVKFEARVLDGKAFEDEPHASEKVATLDPKQVKEALVWLVDLSDKKAYPHEDDRTSKVVQDRLLKDWKRVVALRVRVLGLRSERRGGELADPSDEVHPGDILEEADKKIGYLANRLELLLSRKKTRLDGAPLTWTEADSDKNALAPFLKMGRDDSEGMQSAFEDSYKMYFDLD